MTRTAANPATNLQRSVGEFFGHTRDLLVAPRLGKVLIGTALFWVCGAAMKINFQAWGLGVLQLPNNLQVSLLGLWLSVGVMAGSMLAGQLHAVGDLRQTRKYGFALAGALLLLWTVEPLAFWRQWAVQVGEMRLIPAVIALLVVTGFIAGLFLIPLNAALQAESEATKLGKTIAVQNLCDNVGMLLAGGLVVACTKVGLSAGQVFAAIGMLVVGVVLWLRIPRLEPVKAS
jgi:LPLT family lysophospholipid transporter-like MFS transporter